MTTAHNVKEGLATAFHRALFNRDWALLREIMTSDATWSRDNFALAIHNQPTWGDLVLDEHLVIVCTVTDGRISAVETYLSDIDGMNAYFSSQP
jgi:uncharacterized protein